MKDCIFCKIANGEIPSYKIYEDDDVLAFLDISNDVYGHTLVIPKKHHADMNACDKKVFVQVMEVTKKIAKHYVEDCGFEGFNILNNCGTVADQSIMHFHMHIFPRKTNDNVAVSTKMAGIGDFSDSDKITITRKEEKCALEKICQALQMQQPKTVIHDDKEIILYTDGACSGNPGAGGWAGILMYKGKKKELAGGEKQTTNNRMELMAVISGLESIKINAPVQVFSDSAYVVNAFEKNWIENWQLNNWKTSSKEDVLNKDLWLRLLDLTKKFEVHFNKVKGHSNNEFNNRCDELARKEIEKLND